ncbi:unnamed protein product [Paramecium octaurelia]|uniref:Uncharacterized protein n=1 Tax=Paramecium octaurelia TaxID=43137 RepID=A0A8S1XQN1_PAROT|nr:unnamed protein product [Paramecium octaurelia]
MFVESTIYNVEAEMEDQTVIIKQKIQNEIEEASKVYEITKIESDLRTTLKQQEYLCRLSENIEISILFNYDYPKSNPKYFTQQKFEKSHLIDEDTWQIKIQTENTILSTLNSIIIKFSQNPLCPDQYIQQQIYESIQQFPTPMLQILSSYEMSQFNKILNEQHMYQNPLQALFEIMEEKAMKNLTLYKKVQQIQSEIQELKKDLKLVYNKFQQVQQNATILNAYCNSFLNNFSYWEFRRILQDKLSNLEIIKEQFQELPMKDTLDEKEKHYNQFLNNRIEYHKCNSTLIILKQNINEQSKII